MNYLNGRLRNAQDTTLRLKRDTRQNVLSFWEYVPLAVLIILLASLLIYELLD